ncbi:MAG TPA: glycine dehydrogenase, partial [Spirochaetota bacterium]|nr:glycine dehydrogenase [Spirochaetota bacterium]
MSYISITDAETREMLASIGAAGVDDLFADIPGAIRDGASCELPAALSEIDLERKMRALGSKNRLLPFFLGAGAYCHYIPSVVDQLASRSEFYTAYTPYQPEVSQGTLRAIFEFQTMICS